MFTFEHLVKLLDENTVSLVRLFEMFFCWNLQFHFRIHWHCERWRKRRCWTARRGRKNSFRFFRAAVAELHSTLSLHTWLLNLWMGWERENSDKKTAKTRLTAGKSQVESRRRRDTVRYSKTRTFEICFIVCEEKKNLLKFFLCLDGKRALENLRFSLFSVAFFFADHTAAATHQYHTTRNRENLAFSLICTHGGRLRPLNQCYQRARTFANSINSTLRRERSSVWITNYFSKVRGGRHTRENDEKNIYACKIKLRSSANAFQFFRRAEFVTAFYALITIDTHSLRSSSLRDAIIDHFVAASIVGNIEQKNFPPPITHSLRTRTLVARFREAFLWPYIKNGWGISL